MCSAASGSLYTMGAKYYTHFLLADTSLQGYSEYSGVVEIKRFDELALDAHQIEAILAQNFEIDRDEVKVLDWSRLH
jgi:hypothetical protein